MSLESKYGGNKEWPAKLRRQKHDRRSCAGDIKTQVNEKKKKAQKPRFQLRNCELECATLTLFYHVLTATLIRMQEMCVLYVSDHANFRHFSNSRWYGFIQQQENILKTPNAPDLLLLFYIVLTATGIEP
jgi:hypothetical protein